MSVQLVSEREDVAIARTFRASLNAAERRETPYVNWRLDGVFPEAVARALAALPFQAQDLGGVSGKRELHNDGRRYFAGEVLEQYPVTADVARAFQSDEVVRAIAEYSGANIDGCCLRIEYALDVDGFWLEPHTDLGVKTLTLLIYLPEPGQEELGTDLYAARDAWADRVPFSWNSALMFVPSNNTWHGFEPRPIPTVRRSVIVNYVTSEWRAREQLAYSDTPIRLG